MKELIINEVILNEAQKKGQIIHGAKAYNYQSPDYLKKKTVDYDILTNKPKKTAQEIAERLSKRISDKIKVEKGSHKGTYRVKVGDKVIADYTQKKFNPKTNKIYGVNVRSLSSIKKNAQRLIKKQGTEYRREKDLDTLNRIKRIEELERIFDFN